MKKILLEDAGIGAEFGLRFFFDSGSGTCEAVVGAEHPFHPDVHRECAGMAAGEKQYAVGDFLPYAGQSPKAG